MVNGDILSHNQVNGVYKTLSVYRRDDNKLGEFMASVESQQANILFENLLCDMIDNGLNNDQVVDTFYRYLTHVIENICDKWTQSITCRFPKSVWFNCERKN